MKRFDATFDIEDAEAILREAALVPEQLRARIALLDELALQQQREVLRLRLQLAELRSRARGAPPDTAARRGDMLVEPAPRIDRKAA